MDLRNGATNSESTWLMNSWTPEERKALMKWGGLPAIISGIGLFALCAAAALALPRSADQALLGILAGAHILLLTLVLFSSTLGRVSVVILLPSGPAVAFGWLAGVWLAGGSDFINEQDWGLMRCSSFITMYLVSYVSLLKVRTGRQPVLLVTGILYLPAIFTFFHKI